MLVRWISSKVAKAKRYPTFGLKVQSVQFKTVKDTNEVNLLQQFVYTWLM